MKTILLTIAILCAVSVQGQQQTLQGAITEQEYQELLGLIQYQNDTIPMILLVCDTVANVSMDLVMWPSEIESLKEIQPVFWVRGYEVTRAKSYLGSPKPNADGTVNAVLATRFYREHICYLDNEKKPLKYLVWMAKGVKQ